MRIIGIDTPERDECGYEEAKDALIDLLKDQVVVLVPGAQTDRDVHSRLLRYVELDGADIGLTQIETGLAAARYDSRTDQPHPREDDYWDADDASPDYCG